MIRPLADKVLIERVKAEAVTPGGIVLPDGAKEKSQRGTVISIGESITTLKKGDEVFFTSYAGVEIEHDYHTYMIMSESDVIGVIE